jgi:short-subunit dehydrogenase
MKTIVITGSTRGIGYGMADSLLQMGCAVTISGRTQAAVDQAAAALGTKYGAERIFGFACDVRQLDQVQALWDAALAHFKQIDIWINNAGLAHAITPFADYLPDTIQAVLETNIAGMMNGSMVALQGFRQSGGGAIYTTLGLGSNGRQVKGVAMYGASKSAVAYLNQALVAETQGSPVLVGALAPGMVTTDLLTQQRSQNPAEWERARRVFNILADRVETVSPWLARAVLENRKHGAILSYTNSFVIGWRFLTAPFSHRKVLDD